VVSGGEPDDTALRSRSTASAGRKRWFLTPPHVRPAFHPDQTTLTWLRTHYDDVRRATPQFQECTVRQPPPPPSPAPPVARSLRAAGGASPGWGSLAGRVGTPSSPVVPEEGARQSGTSNSVSRSRSRAVCGLRAPACKWGC